MEPFVSTHGSTVSSKPLPPRNFIHKMREPSGVSLPMKASKPFGGPAVPGKSVDSVEPATTMFPDGSNATCPANSRRLPPRNVEKWSNAARIMVVSYTNDAIQALLMLNRAQRFVKPLRERRDEDFGRRNVGAFINLQAFRLAKKLEHRHRLGLQRRVFVVAPVEHQLRLPDPRNEIDSVCGRREFRFDVRDSRSGECHRTNARVERGDEHARPAPGTQTIKCHARVIEIRPRFEIVDSSAHLSHALNVVIDVLGYLGLGGLPVRWMWTAEETFQLDRENRAPRANDRDQPRFDTVRQSAKSADDVARRCVLDHLQRPPESLRQIEVSRNRFS